MIRNLVSARVIVRSERSANRSLAGRLRAPGSHPRLVCAGGYRIEIEGEPRVEASISFVRPTGDGISDETDVMGVLLVGTAMPAVHAIPFVSNAAPGMTTPANL